MAVSAHLPHSGKIWALVAPGLCLLGGLLGILGIMPFLLFAQKHHVLKGRISDMGFLVFCQNDKTHVTDPAL